MWTKGPGVHVPLAHFDALTISPIDVNREPCLSLLIKRSASFINYLRVIPIHLQLTRLQGGQ